MIGLIRVELARFGTRRVIALLVLLAALAAALIAAKTAWDTRPLTRDEVATAQLQADIEADRADIKADLARCLEDPAQYLGPGATTQQCRDSLVPAAKSYYPRQPLDLSGTLKGNGLGAALLVSGILLIAGATFAGGDWASGTIVTQLLFEPRRLRLWTAKGIAVTLGTGVVAAVVLGGFWAAMYAVAAARDLAPSGQVTTDIVWHVVRAVLLAAGGALGAFALSMLFRSTAATLGLLFVYAVGGELLITLLPFDGAARWLLGNNVFGWLEKHLEYYDPTTACLGLTDCGPEHLGHLAAGLYLLGLLAVAVLVSLAVFRRRDVS